MQKETKHDFDIQYTETGVKEAAPLVLLHGLFGSLSNWKGLIEGFSDKYRVLVPHLPVYEGPKNKANLSGLLEYMEAFVAHLKLDNMVLIGNSLGGHLGLLYALKHPQCLKSLVLICSSGLFENPMGFSFMRIKDYHFIKRKVAYTFYDPKVAVDELVDDVFAIAQNVSRALRVIAFARSAQRNNLSKELGKIETPHTADMGCQRYHHASCGGTRV